MLRLHSGMHAGCTGMAMSLSCIMVWLVWRHKRKLTKHRSPPTVPAEVSSWLAFAVSLVLCNQECQGKIRFHPWHVVLQTVYLHHLLRCFAWTRTELAGCFRTVFVCCCLLTLVFSFEILARQTRFCDSFGDFVNLLVWTLCSILPWFWA